MLNRFKFPSNSVYDCKKGSKRFEFAFFVVIIFSIFSLSCKTTCITPIMVTTQGNLEIEIDTIMPKSEINTNMSDSNASTFEMNIVIPEYHNSDSISYKELETIQSMELLEANGIGHSPTDLRKACYHPIGLLRGTAYLLLTRHPQNIDKEIFKHGINDPDEMVQVLAAYGLYKLGYKSYLPIIQKIAQSDVTLHLEAMRAASILAELGHPSAFATIAEAFKSDLDYVRLFAIKNLMAFIPYHGQDYQPDMLIDIWAFYQIALQDKTPEVRNIAKLQLKSIVLPEAQNLLQNIK